jgi:hypothetical protein
MQVSLQSQQIPKTEPEHYFSKHIVACRTNTCGSKVAQHGASTFENHFFRTYDACVSLRG